MKHFLIFSLFIFLVYAEETNSTVKAKNTFNTEQNSSVKINTIDRIISSEDFHGNIAPQKVKKDKKKKKKVKYIKKRSQVFWYQKYLSYLSNKRPIGTYDYKYKFGGQFSYDLGYIDQAPDTWSNEPQPFSDHKFRRARVFHGGSFLDQKVFYEMEYSLLDNKDHFKDFYFGYQNKLNSLDLNYRIKFGNIKIPVDLNRYTTSKNLSFMERPLGDDAFSIGRKMGFELFLYKKLQQHRFGLFYSSFSNSIDEKINHLTQYPGNSLRLTYNYKIEKNNLFHIELGRYSQEYKKDDLRLRQNSESEILSTKYVSTKIKNTDNLTVKNYDLYYQDHKYSGQAGYKQIDISSDQSSYIFYSYFMEGSYFILGKGKQFDLKESKFSKIKPTKDGAIEAAIRYSYINLNNKDEQGGEQTNYSVALNWYLNSEIKIMTNYIVALPKDTDDYDGLINIYQMRIQFAF